MKLSPEIVARSLGALAERSMPCPFCGLAAKDLLADERGPRLEMSEASLDEALSTPAGMTHQVYCPGEDRNFLVAYRPRGALPECPGCESDFDVLSTPPPRHFHLTSEFVAEAHCESCGEELGPVVYEAFDVRDLGLLGN